MRRRNRRSWTGSVVGATVVLVAFGVAVGQESPYSEWTDRDIKALSEDRTWGYLEGHGMGFALAAELNGYPGPKHVLEMSQDLGLSIQQRDEMQQLFDSMRHQAVQLGREILEREGALDESFVAGSIEEARLIRLTEEIGRLNGRLRGVHLKAHLEAVRILSPHQRQRYAVLRGYSGHEDHDPSRHQ